MYPYILVFEQMFEKGRCRDTLSQPSGQGGRARTSLLAGRKGDGPEVGAFPPFCPGREQRSPWLVCGTFVECDKCPATAPRACAESGGTPRLEKGEDRYRCHACAMRLGPPLKQEAKERDGNRCA